MQENLDSGKAVGERRCGRNDWNIDFGFLNNKIEELSKTITSPKLMMNVLLFPTTVLYTQTPRSSVVVHNVHHHHWGTGKLYKG